jgi:cytochrome c-type biogenesis protein
VLASVLTYAAANSQSPWRGAGYLAVYAAGLALPLLILASVAARATAWIKRFRTALPKLEKLTGAVLLAVGVWSLIGVGQASAVRSPVALATSHSPDCAEGPAGHTCALPHVAPSVDPRAPISLKGVHLVEFTAPDCPVCQKMRPVMDKLAAACSELEQKTVRVDVATPSGRAIADEHVVRGTPTFLLLDEHGIERERLLGEQTASDVATAIERATGLSCWG